MEKIEDKLNDAKEELNWLRGYAQSLEEGIKEMRVLINESSGVAGYHLNRDIALWDELIADSQFSFAEANMQRRKKFTGKFGHITTEPRKELFIKEYEGMPITVQYTPVYGGIKYVRKDT